MVGEVPCDLRHPGFMRLTRDAGDLHGARLQLHDKEDDVPDQPAQGQYLDGEKVRRRQTVPMSRQEGLPRCLRTALWRGHDAVVLEDRFDRVSGDVVTEVLEPAADTRVAPRRVLLRHADDKRGDVRLRARTAGTSLLRAVVLVGDQKPVPAQDRVRCHDAGDVRETLPSEGLPFHGESPPLIVGEANASRAVCRAEDPVLLQQVLDDVLLLSIDPAGEQQEQEGERGWQPIH